MTIKNLGYGLVQITADENKSLQKISDETICRVVMLGKGETSDDYIHIDKIESED